MKTKKIIYFEDYKIIIEYNSSILDLSSESSKLYALNCDLIIKKKEPIIFGLYLFFNIIKYGIFGRNYDKNSI